MIYLLFAISHLTGDFLLQTGTIAAWKARSFWGLLVHVLIVTLAFLVVCIPYLGHWQVGAAIGINFVVHLAQDHIKLRYPTFRGSPIVPYFLDQLGHVITFFALGAWISHLQPNLFLNSWWIDLYQNERVLLYVLGILLFSYFSDITLFIYQIAKKGPHRYERQYFWMLFRVFLFAMLFIVGYIVVGR